MVVAGEEETDRTRERREPPMRSRQLGAQAATGDAKSKWTLQMTSPELVQRGVEATVVEEGEEGSSPY